MARWAKDWDCCQECGTTDRPHCAHGLCGTCYQRQYRKEHPNYARDYQRQWRADHPNHEKLAVICKECGEEKPHQAHGLCKTCYNQQYRDEHPAWWGEYRRQYRIEYHKEIAEYQRQWRKENPEIARAISRRANHRRRSRLASVTIEPVDEQKIYSLYDNICIYCESKEGLTLDHVVPLNSGGAHAEGNLVVACAHCNYSKQDRPLEEWLQTQPRARAWVM